MTSAAVELSHVFVPRGACHRLFKVRDAEVLISGPAGTGKSRACLEKLHAVALANPGMRGLIVRKVAASLTSSALVTWRRDVIPEAVSVGAVSFYGGSAEQPPQYRYHNGSVVAIGGMDKEAGRDKIMSTEYDMVYVQEATELTLEDWESLTTRMRNGVVSFQQMLADCNPSFATHWLKNRCDKGGTLMLHSKHSDNPRLVGDDGGYTEYGRDYMGRLDALTGVIRERLRDGKWSSAAGVIYSGWDPGVHLVDGFVPPRDWVRWWAVDWGFTNPFVCQCWAEDPDGRLFLYRELYETGRTVDQHAAKMMSIVRDSEGGWLEPRPRVVVADHDPEAQVVWRRETGLGCVDAVKDVKAGIQAVTRRLVVAGDGRPRLFVMRGASMVRDSRLVESHKPTSTEEEVPGYVWHDKKEEEPVKEGDHGMDAMRYVVMHREVQSGARFRVIR